MTDKTQGWLNRFKLMLAQIPEMERREVLDDLLATYCQGCGTYLEEGAKCYCMNDE